MSIIDRRDFVRTAVTGAAVLRARCGWADPPTADPGSRESRGLQATDTVALGQTGIKASRLAFGTGSNGAEQRLLGTQGLARLLRYAKDRGVYWWDTADMYQTHPHVREALKNIRREEVVILTKSLAKEPAELRRDIDRFRTELGTDYLDILLLHCMSQADWPQQQRALMDVLSKAKDQGHLRAMGCSLHVMDDPTGQTLGALSAAAQIDWGDLYMVRINPFAVEMDVGRPEYIPRVERLLRLMHARGKIIYGMKILGGADPHRHAALIQGDKIDQSLKFVLSRPYVSAFTIGFSRPADLDNIIDRIDRLACKPETTPE
jgi:predicted aldo/keto reductase-like oxidoreductase